jgi:hypothetical protein
MKMSRVFVNKGSIHSPGSRQSKMVTGIIDIIRALAGSSEAERQAAETAFDQQWASDPQVLPALLQVVCDEQVEAPLRTLAAVLFRRSLSRTVEVPLSSKPQSLWSLMVPQEAAQCKQRLLQVFSRPSPANTQSLCLKIADALAEMARLVILHDERWEQLSSILGDPSQDPQMVLRVLGDVPALLSPFSGKQLTQLFERFLLHSQDPTVRVAALKALELVVDDMVGEGGQDERLKPLGSLVLRLDAVLSPVLGGDDESLKTEALNALTELIITCPKLFKDIAPSLISALIPLPSDTNGEQGVRSAAMEAILNVLEELPSSVRKNKALVAQLVHLGFQLTGEVEDDAEWYEADSDFYDPADIDPIGTLGEQAIDRLSIALGSKAVFEPLFMHLIAPALSSTAPDWKPKYAALKCVASGAEGCQDVLEDRLGDLLGLLWPCFSADQHARVHFAACHALGQLCTDFSGVLQLSFCSQALTALLQVLQTSQVTCVQQHAAAALVNFAEGVDQAVVAPFLDDLITTLVRLLPQSSAKPGLQQQLIATIAAFSSVAGRYFAQHYDTVVGLLLPCIDAGSEAATPELRMLQVRAVEAISLFAHAVGKARFVASDTGQLFLGRLVDLTERKFDADDWKDFLPSAWIRIAQVLQEDFLPFAPLVVSKLQASATQEADLALLDADTNYDSSEYPEEDWDFVVRGGRRLGIRTSGLEDKYEATSSLVSIVQSVSLGAAQLKDLHDLVFLSLLEFDFHEGVQASAAEGLLAVASRGFPGLNVVDDCKAMMLQALKLYSGEFATSVVDTLVGMFEQSLVQLGDLPQLPLWLDKLGRKVCQELKSDQRHSSQEEAAGDEAGDDEDHNEYGENEDVVYAMSRLVRAVGKPLGLSIAPSMADLSCKFAQLPASRHAGLCLLAELVKQGNVDVSLTEASVRKTLERSLRRNDDPDVQQVACFALGLAALTAPAWHPWIFALTPQVLGLIDAGSGNLSDNAVACIARMLQACSLQADFVLHVWPKFAAGFPVVTDTDEVPLCYQTLLKVLSLNPSLSRDISAQALQAPFSRITDDSVLEQLTFLGQFLREHHLSP